MFFISKADKDGNFTLTRKPNGKVMAFEDYDDARETFLSLYESFGKEVILYQYYRDGFTIIED